MLPTKLPVSVRNSDENKSKFGVYRGMVVDVIYTDDERNSNKERIEYTVRVNGQLYPNVIDVRALGGIYNHSEVIRKSLEVDAGIEPIPYEEVVDGEHVVVAFLHGHADYPVILGGLPHTGNPVYKKGVKNDGRYARYEYNGIEFLTDKDGTLTIKQRGIKDKDGVITNTGALDAADPENPICTEIKIDGQTGDLSLTRWNGHKVEFVGDDLNIDVPAGNVTVNAVDANINASGNATIVAGGDVILKSANNTPGSTGFITDLPANADPITGIPLTPVGGVKPE